MLDTKRLAALDAELTANKLRKRDLIADTRQLTAAEDGTLHIDGHGPHVIGPHAHKQIAERLNIPSRYYDLMRQEAPELLATNINHWFDKTPGRRMLRTLTPEADSKPVVRAFLSDAYRTIDHEDVASAVLPALLAMPGVEFDECRVTDERMYIKAWLPAIFGEVTPGDKVFAGVIISNSEIGMGASKVEQLVRREVCGNNLLMYGQHRGKASENGVRMAHLGARAAKEDKVYAMLRDETREAKDKADLMVMSDVIKGLLSAETFQTTVKELKNAAEDVIEGRPLKAVELLTAQHGLREAEHESVLAHLLGSKDMTRWGVVNAITRAAQDVGSYDRRTELERLGGQVLSLPRKEWRELALAA